MQGGLLKKVLDSIKDLVNEANFDVSATGFRPAGHGHQPRLACQHDNPLRRL